MLGRQGLPGCRRHRPHPELRTTGNPVHRSAGGEPVPRQIPRPRRTGHSHPQVVLSEDNANATASRLNSAVYRLLVLPFLVTTCDCFLRDHPSQYQAVQVEGELCLRRWPCSGMAGVGTVPSTEKIGNISVQWYEQIVEKLHDAVEL